MDYIAVWEARKGLNKGWETYGGDLCALLEKAFDNYAKNPIQNKILRLPQNRTFDFSNNEESDSSAGRVYPIRRVEMPGDCAVAKQITWRWDCSENGSLNWRPYSANVVNLLEVKFNQDARFVELTQDLTQLDFDYSVDLNNMSQTNKQTKKRRYISRDRVEHPFPRVAKRATSSQQQQQQQPSDDRRCKICLDQQAEMAFVPCGHLCCCSRCSTSMRNCPLCRAAFTNTIRIYV